MSRRSRPEYRLSCIVRPGRLPAAEQEHLFRELVAVAERCFAGEVPSYQILTGSAEDMNRAVVALARDTSGRLAGFCSCLLLDVEGVGEVFHLGLSCVDPADRSNGLTHRLMSKAVSHYLVRHRLFSTVWFSNVACVLSSLGNVALNFDDVYPSPMRTTPPSDTHRRVARAIADQYRSPIAISESAVLDEDAFVFRGSVPGTCFEKGADDQRYHHRNPALTSWYAQRMSFQNGDEVIQVGSFSLLGFVRYAVRRLWKGTRVPELSLPGVPAPVSSPALEH